jgi:hypothetical protein
MATMQGRGEIATPHAFERYGGVSISATETSAAPQLLNCLGDQYVVSNTSSNGEGTAVVQISRGIGS